jgi:hypothetical protein
MFGFDMFVHGVRGERLPEADNLTDEELELYGVDWEGLRDNDVLQSHQTNNPIEDEGWSSWVGRTGMPETLSDVPVEPPSETLLPAEVEFLDNALQQWLYSGQLHDIVALWSTGLRIVRTMYHDVY